MTAGHERTVKAIVTTYFGPDGAPRVGLRGEKVTVGAKHVDAFDESEKEHTLPSSAPASSIQEIDDDVPARRSAK